MNAFHSIVPAGLLVGAAVPTVLAQSKTREEVRAEAASAAKAGQIDRGELTSTPALRPSDRVGSDAGRGEGRDGLGDPCTSARSRRRAERGQGDAGGDGEAEG